jgi:hypothetical protein
MQVVRRADKALAQAKSMPSGSAYVSSPHSKEFHQPGPIDTINRSANPLTRVLGIFRDRMMRTSAVEGANFRKVNVLGKGGCGVVWRCEQIEESDVCFPTTVGLLTES